MILIANASFPKTSIQTAAKKFTQIKKLPATVKRLGPFFSFHEKDKVNATAVYIFREGQISQEEKKFIEHRLKEFSEVPGFSYTLSEWLNMEETLLFLKKNG